MAELLAQRIIRRSRLPGNQVEARRAHQNMAESTTNQFAYSIMQSGHQNAI